MKAHKESNNKKKGLIQEEEAAAAQQQWRMTSINAVDGVMGGGGDVAEMQSHSLYRTMSLRQDRWKSECPVMFFCPNTPRPSHPHPGF